MRRVVTIVLGCVLGLAAAFAFAYLADIVRPCTGEQLSCSMTKILGIVYIPVFSVVALIVFSVALFWKNTVHAVNIAVVIPLGAFLLFIAFVEWSAISVREFHEIRERDIQELLQVVIPIVLTLVIPWVVVRRFVSPRQADTAGA